MPVCRRHLSSKFSDGIFALNPMAASELPHEARKVSELAKFGSFLGIFKTRKKLKASFALAFDRWIPWRKSPGPNFALNPVAASERPNGATRGSADAIFGFPDPVSGPAGRSARTQRYPKSPPPWGARLGALNRSQGLGCSLVQCCKIGFQVSVSTNNSWFKDW